jgi:hypothetical protein
VISSPKAEIERIAVTTAAVPRILNWVMIVFSVNRLKARMGFLCLAGR